MVSEPVSEKFGTEKSPGTGLENIWYRKKSRNRSQNVLVPKKSRNRSRKNLIPKSLRIGSKKIWYRKVPEPDLNFVVLVSVSSRSRDFCLLYGIESGLEKNLAPKKVSEPVSENFGTEKSLGIAIVQILGLVTHWITCCVEILGNWCGQTALLLIKYLFYTGKKSLVLKHLFWENGGFTGGWQDYNKIVGK